MPLEPNTYGRLAKCRECKSQVWQCRWSGYPIQLDAELVDEIPPVGRGVGAMRWRPDVGAWGSVTDRAPDDEVRLVHKCPGRPTGATESASKRESESEAAQVSADPWQNPGSSSGVDFETLKGRLLIVTPHSTEEINTSFGEKEAVRADLVVVDEPGGAVEFLDTLIFPKVLIGQLRSAIGTGKMILGRLEQGIAKPGQKPPWRLADPDDADRKIAGAWYKQSQAKSLPF